ncbi:non-ribosomal peptide synthetase [Streptomyces sp. RT42]|uniref:non-ribosomal peptide synthetase n=2 Tax=unclassified Streptomyces TaxID=2593676 RepID=UPI001B38F275|nr:non-ribosomal peptide synthetase [Streptomyces sp. RT42]MBQ0881644.1 amino acid adenylation domain-containing protein [Streptomyces sp. RT42]
MSQQPSRSRSKIEDILPLSPLQEGFVFLGLLHTEGPDLYVGQVAFDLEGPFDGARMRAAAEALLRRHANLRAGFRQRKNGAWAQLVLHDVDLPWQDADLSALPEDERGPEADRLAAADRARRFDLGRPPLLRFTAIRLSAGHVRLVMTNHHIVLDGWSMPVLLRELMALYASGGDPAALPRVRPYREYLAWLDARDREAARTAWQESLSGLDEATLLAPAGSAASTAPEHVSFTVDPEVSGALAAWARGHGVTMNTVVQGAWALALTQATGRDDVVFGATVSGRPPELPGVESMIGLFINTLPVRARLDHAEPLGDLFRRLQAEQARLLDHQWAGLADIQRWAGHGELFDTAMVFQNYPVEDGDLTAASEPDRLQVASADIKGGTHFAVNVVATMRGAELSFRVDYRPDLYDEEYARDFGRRMLRVLEALIADSDIPVARLDTLDPAERERVLVEWNGPRTELPGTPLHELITEQAHRTPDKTAVACGDASLTYAELDARANQLARHLLEQGVGAEDFVAITLPKSLDAITSMLAVLKTGAAYLPIDPDYPTERITYILDDARPALTLTEPIPEEQYAGHPTTTLTDTDRRSPWSPRHAAYMIYTSGSTGRPKGVIIEHHALATYLHRARTTYTAMNGDTVLHSPLAFDLTITALWTPLTAGGTVHLTSLEETVTQPSLIKATPSHLPLLTTLPETASPSHTLILGGEALHTDHLTAWRTQHPHVQIINAYGPTESTVNITDHHVNEDTPDGPVPIGRPFANTQVYVLDAALRPVPPGITGELYLAGEQLARGYHGRPALTSERFVANPFGNPGTRLYRTGDLAHWNHHGHLTYDGRTDHQIKLRGHRIELGEIDTTLNNQPGITQATVQLREDTPGDQRLVAYLVTTDEYDAEATTAALRGRLPDYMVPTAYVTLDALPLTPNGKLDRKALPAPTYTPTTTGRTPRTPREEILCTLFAEILGVGDVTIDDNFFDLGGHSLLATRLVSRVRSTLGVELPIRQLFETPTVAGLADALDTSGTVRTALTAKPRPERIPLSYAQQRLWFLHQLEGPSATYNIPTTLRLTGVLDHDALRAATGDLIARHESLRTVFTEDEQGAYQIVLPAEVAATPFTVVDVTEEEVADRVAEAASYPFDLTADLPVRMWLFRVSEQEHVLLLLVHHIASDAWSRTPLAQDLTAAYTARRAGDAPAWQALPVQYADYALWQQEVLGDETDADSLAGRQLDYWKRQLADLPEQLDLPTDRPRPATADHTGDRVTFTVPAELHTRLTDLARSTNTTTFMVLQAALATLLTRHGAGEDIPIGTPIAGRTDDATDHLIGFFVNTLVLRTDTSGNPTFRDLLTRVRDTDLTAYAHQDLPFERLVEALNPTRSLAHHPLFQTMLTLHNTQGAKAERFADLAAEVVASESVSARFDLSFALAEHFGDGNVCEGMSGGVTYSTALFDRETVRDLADRLVRLLAAAVAHPGRPVGQLEIMDAAERRLVLEEWNDTAAEPPADFVVGLFERQARRSPDATAVEFGDTRLSYGQLNARANRLARHLVARGAAPGRFVAVALPRSAELVVTLLAVLKSGAAYLPVDPHYPADRVAYMLDDAGPALTLTEPVAEAELAGYAGGDLDAGELRGPVLGAHPAYAIYTSGSTGRPKGVVVPRAALGNFLADMGRRFAPTDGDRLLAVTTVGFDIAGLEIFLPLLHGAVLVLADEETAKDPHALLRAVTASGITMVQATPSLWQGVAAVAADELAGVRVLVGGEALSPELARTLTERARSVTNLYGPTEVTIWATAADVAESGPVIGVPLANTSAYVLDAALRPVPVGVPGELYLAGEQLAQGYHRRPSLTSERFTADPYGPAGARMYRTGDLVCRRRDGALRYLSRVDQQVKLRGFRIELGEIEAELVRQTSVAETVVTIREDRPGDRRLVAYVVPAGPAPDVRELRERLWGRLPEFMVPTAFVTLDALPLTPNGKLDRKALPAPEYDGEPAGRGPRGPREEILCALFADVLGVARVGIDDGFFDLGGHSLLASRLVSRIRTALGVELSVRQFFETPTIAGLSGVLDGAAAARTPLVARERPRRVPLSPAQQRLWFLHQFEGPSATYNVPTALRLSGPVDRAALGRAIDDVLERHESLRTVFAVDDDGSWQIVLPADPSARRLEVVDVTAEEVEERVADAARHVFDLTADIPFLARLFRVSETDHVLLLLVHHIAGDGWSMAPLARDLTAAYAARRAGDAPGWEPLPVQYADYALWQRDVLGDESDPESVAARQLVYWKEALAGLPEQLELPTDRPRPATAGYTGDRIAFTVPPALHARLTELARATHSSLFMVTQAAFAALLTRLGAGEDIPIGTAVAGRNDAATEDLVGFFVNTLVLRTDTGGNPTFRELLGRVREGDLAAYAHQEVPFERLVEAVNPARSLAHHPLYQVMITFNNTADRNAPRAASGDGDGDALVNATRMTAGTGVAKFDLSLTFGERHDASGGPAGMRGSLEYRTELFDRETAESLISRLLGVLGSVTADPDLPIGGIGLLDPAERRQLLQEWNDTARPQREGTLPELFEEQVARTPRDPAFSADGTTLTYAELNSRANRLAHLLAESGAGPEQVVAISLPPSVEMGVAVLAVLKTGAAYLPVDPGSPRERIATMTEDAAPVCALTTSAVPDGVFPDELPRLLLDDPDVTARLAAQPVHDLTDEDRTQPLSPWNAAYIIYTSGSTGRPKGVLVEHQPVLNYLAVSAELYPGVAGHALLHSPLSFDLTVTGLFAPLLNGGCVHLADLEELHERALDGEVPADLPQVTFLKATPSHLPLITGLPGVCVPDGELVLGGESLTGRAVRALLAAHPGARVLNEYGPTETIVGCTTWRVETPDDLADGVLTIGRPFPNTRMLVLDPYLQPVPAGVPGELYVSGVQLARGYLNRPGQSASRFVADPFGEPGERMYRTGDIVRWNRHGDLEFISRVDDQVKIRGFRVELGEVESALSRHPAVPEAVAVVREDRPGDRRLVAYLVADAGPVPSDGELREWLRESLPDYMVPSAFVRLAELPLTANGKLDRGRLPAPDYVAAGTGRAPTTAREELLCALFAEALGLESVGVDDGFFDLGGDSILSIQLVSRARAKGLTLSVRDVFEHQSVAHIAEALDGAEEPEPDAGRREEVPASGPVPATPIMGWFAGLGGPIAPFNQSVVVSVPADLDEERLVAALGAVVDRHDSLRLRVAGDWTMTVPEPGTVDTADLVTHLRAPDVDDDALRALVAEAAVAERDRLDPFDGRMLRACRIDRGPGRPGLLVLVAHHLAVDAVSWRLLVPDLAAAYEGSPLSPAGTHWREWAGALRDLAGTAVTEAETDHWLDAVRPAAEPTDPALDPARDTHGRSGQVVLDLDAETTDALLTWVPGVFRAEINDLLLTAFGLAVADWRRARGGGAGAPVTVDLESHGRHEHLVPGADLTRTTGWFTSMHPVPLRPEVDEWDWPEVWDGGAAAGRALKRVKEQLRAVPRDGVGYGLLRHLNPRTRDRFAALPVPAFGFNYLGRYTGGRDAGPGAGPQAWSVLGRGVAGQHPDTPLAHPVELVAGAHDTDEGPRLHSVWTYADAVLSEGEVRRLAEGWFRALKALVEHAGRPEASGLTPSDVSLTSLSEDDITRLESEWGSL